MAYPPLPGLLSQRLLAALLFVIPFSKAAIELLFPVMLVAWLGSRWFRGQKPSGKGTVLHSSTLYALLAYTAYAAWSISYSDFPDLSLRAWVGKTLEYSLMFVIAYDIVDRPGTAARGLNALFRSTWVVLAYGALQESIIHNPWKGSAMPMDPIFHQPLNYIRMVGPYENPNDLATYLMVMSLLAGAQILTNRRKRNYFFLSGLLVFSLIWTRSLGALLGFMAGAVLLGLLHIRRRRIVLGGLIAAGVAFFIFLSTEPHIREVFTLTDVASQDRMTMWKTAWRITCVHPVIGHGLNTFMANYQRFAPDPHQWPAYAHNCYLQIAAETGLIGLAVFLWFLLSFFAACFQSLRLNLAPSQRTPEQRAHWSMLAGLTAGLTAFLVQSAFDTNLYSLRQAALFWTLAGFSLGISRLLDRAS